MFIYFLFFHFQVPISHFASHCERRLERAQHTGAKKGVRKPTLEEIEQAKVRHLSAVAYMEL